MPLFPICTSLVYLSKFKKYFMCCRGENLIFLCITTWWLCLGWHQRRPVFMTCTDTDIPCKVRSSVPCFHMDTTVSAGAAPVTDTAGTDGDVGQTKRVQEQLLYSSSYTETWPWAFGWHKGKRFSAGHRRQTWGWDTPRHRGRAPAPAAPQCLCSVAPGFALGPGLRCEGLTASNDTSSTPPVWPLCSCCFSGHCSQCTLKE